MAKTLITPMVKPVSFSPSYNFAIRQTDRHGKINIYPYTFGDKHSHCKTIVSLYSFASRGIKLISVIDIQCHLICIPCNISTTITC